MNLRTRKQNSSELFTPEMLDIIFKDRMRYASLHSAALNHELQTPLVIIRGLAESLLRKSGQETQRQLREIANEAGRLLQILDAMVFVSPTDPWRLQNVSLKTVIDQVIIFFERICLERGISIRVNVDEKEWVESEPNRLKSILGALIQNAIESFANKPIRESKSITIHIQNEGGKKHLIVSDNGGGISAAKQKQIREDILLDRAPLPFDFGLGLALAHKSANELGATLSFVSEEFRGTSFTITFGK